jgi:glutamate racemase
MIGIFDSGIGGFGILRKIKMFLPNEDVYYYADNKNVPYGDKTIPEIQALTLAAIKFLEKKGCTIIVISCNTATTSGIDIYRKHTKAKIIGVVPVVKTAAQITHNNKIAILATKRTIVNKYLDQLIAKFANKCEIKKIACIGWADAIEKNCVTDALLKKYLKKIKQEDVVILGCTHYPLIKGRIQNILGSEVRVIHSNEAVARHVMRVGTKYKLLNNKDNKAKYFFICSGNKKLFKQSIKQYFN